ncbi:MAG: pentapeptide repeat-containing protein [Armatimonadetes bacterium]|nr:pentapeptide repeat-containing protein [Armatimonadota bacterium]
MINAVSARVWSKLLQLIKWVWTNVASFLSFGTLVVAYLGWRVGTDIARDSAASNVKIADNARLAEERKWEAEQLNAKLQGAKDSLTKADKNLERINALTELVNVAMLPTTGGHDVGTSVPTVMPPPSKADYGKFEEVVGLITIVLQRDDDQTIRDAASQACARLCRFARGEFSDQTYKDFSGLPERALAIPMTASVIMSLAAANQAAYRKWKDELATFIGVAQAVGQVQTVETTPLHALPSAGHLPEAKTTLGSMRAEVLEFEAKYLSSKAPRIGTYAPLWTSPDALMQLAEELSHFVVARSLPGNEGIIKERAILLNEVFIAEASADTRFQEKVRLSRMAFAARPAANWQNEWAKQQESLRLATARLQSTRDAISECLLEININAVLPKRRDEPPRTEAMQGWESKPHIEATKDQRYRFGLPLSRCALPGIALSDVSLEFADLRGTLMHGALLTRTNFRGANMEGAVFPCAVGLNTIFVDADLGGASFPWCQLKGAQFYFAVGSDTHFDDSDLSGASFNCAQFKNSTFRRAAVQLVAADYLSGHGNVPSSPRLGGCRIVDRLSKGSK